MHQHSHRPSQRPGSNPQTLRRAYLPIYTLDRRFAAPLGDGGRPPIRCDGNGATEPTKFTIYCEDPHTSRNRQFTSLVGGVWIGRRFGIREGSTRATQACRAQSGTIGGGGRHSAELCQPDRTRSEPANHHCHLQVGCCTRVLSVSSDS